MSTQLALFEAQYQRERILRVFAEDHRVYLNMLRSLARIHAMRHGSVTIDDVRTAALDQGQPLPEELGIDQRVLGALFLRKEFRAVGQRLTTRAERVARAGKNSSYVTVYELA